MNLFYWALLSAITILMPFGLGFTKRGRSHTAFKNYITVCVSTELILFACAFTFRCAYLIVDAFIVYEFAALGWILVKLETKPMWLIWEAAAYFVFLFWIILFTILQLATNYAEHSLEAMLIENLFLCILPFRIAWVNKRQSFVVTLCAGIVLFFGLHAIITPVFNLVDSSAKNQIHLISNAASNIIYAVAITWGKDER